MASIHHFTDRDRWEVFWRDPATGRQRGRNFESLAAARRFAAEVDVARAAHRLAAAEDDLARAVEAARASATSSGAA